MEAIKRILKRMKQMNLWFFDQHLEKYELNKDKTQRIAYSFTGVGFATISLLFLVSRTSAFVNVPFKEKKEDDDFRLQAAKHYNFDYWLTKISDVEKVAEFGELEESL